MTAPLARLNLHPDLIEPPGHIKINYVFGATIAIAHGNDDGGDKDGRDSVRRAAKSGGYCAAKTTPPNETFALRVIQHSLRPAMPVRRKQIDHRALFT